jgi:hypothetical protein
LLWAPTSLFLLATSWHGPPENTVHYSVVPAESFAHDKERTLVRAEYGYPEGSPKPTVKEETRRYSSQ